MRAVFLVHTNAEPGREAEFNDWYDNTHLPDLLRVPGFVAATRYRLSGDQMDRFKPPQSDYLAIYEIDCDDPAAALAEMKSRVGTEQMVISSAMVASGDESPSATLYEAL